MTPTLLSAFWTYTLITAIYARTEQILPPLALLRRMDFVKVPACWQGMSPGIFDCDVTVCGHFIFTGSD